MLMKKLNRGFFQHSKGHNSKINDPIWPEFKFIRGFIHVHLICKFQEDPIRTEQVMLRTKSNRCFFSIQGDVTLRCMIRIACYQTRSRFHPCSSYLWVSGRPDQNLISYADNKVKKKRCFFSNRGDVTLKQIYFNLAKFRTCSRFIHVHLTCKFQADPVKTERVMLMAKSYTDIFSNQADIINGRIRPVLEHVRDFIHVHRIYKFQEDFIKTRWVRLMTKSNRGFFIVKGRQSKTNEPIWPGFNIISDFIPVHIICKFKEYSITSEWVMLMTKSNRGVFFSNQGDITLRLIIKSVQVSNPSEIVSVCILSASFRKIQSKLNKLC